jgi:TPR repeat protein
MPLRDLLKKKDRIDSNGAPAQQSTLPQASEFTFMRTDTNTQETIAPPSFVSENDAPPSPEPSTATSPRKSLFRRSPKISPVHAVVEETSPPQKNHRRLSQRLGLKDRGGDGTSTNLPASLPTIYNAYSDQGDIEEKEAQWEDRATRLAGKSPNLQGKTPPPDISQLNINDTSASRSSSRPRSVSDAKSDVNIQEAIRLHEEGSLEAATAMFRQLAESGNVLSQVLYGLSLRHGWGCEPDPQGAVTYLSQAASNSAEIESQALHSGMKKGGAAKGELVLAIFELANCFRHGWGVPVDKVAARQYYETAANLGDTDAMNEAAWCYLEGFGGKKDKVSRFSRGFINLAFVSSLARDLSLIDASDTSQKEDCSHPATTCSWILDGTGRPQITRAKQSEYRACSLGASLWASMQVTLNQPSTWFQACTLH